MQMITSNELSKYRQRLRQLIDTIDKLAYRCAHSDPLVHGTPGKVYRTCGKKSCKSAGDPSERHGPYLVLQVRQDNKQRQISLRKDQKEVWEKAKNYQKQQETLLSLKKSCEELTDTVKELLTKRLEKIPK